MDVIVLSHMYPKSYSPYGGIFVHEQVAAIKKHLSNGSVTVISPVPWSPRCLWIRKKWRVYGQAEEKKQEEGIMVYCPRYLVIPGRFFFPMQGIFIFISIILLMKKLIKNKPNVILHTHTILPDGLAGIFVKKIFKLPHICTIHGSDINIRPHESKITFLLTRYALKRCDRIVTVSNKLKEKVQLIAGDLQNISVIYNGADGEKFRPMPKDVVKRRLGIKGNSRIVIFIGNLLPIKGVGYLIRAFSDFLKQHKNDNFKLFLIGSGQEREKLVELTKRLDVEANVVFLGRKPHEEIPLWLNIADILVLPSSSEGFPTIIPEAFMCEIPVVASNVGGIPEIIIDGKTGILTKPGDIAGITEGLNLSIKKTFRERLILEVRKYSQRFTWSVSASEMLIIYENLLNNR